MPAKGTYGVLKCRKCKATGTALTVSRARQELRVHDEEIVHARVDCACGNWWWSRHKEAVATSRALDEVVEGAAGR